MNTTNYVGEIGPDATEALGWDETSEATVALLRQIPSRHPLRYIDREALSLYDAIGVDSVRARLHESETSGDSQQYDAACIAVTDRITECVSRALHFPPEGADLADPRLPAAMGNLVSDQIVNCYGFTALTSACLELVGLRHFIGWGNGHSFILLPTATDGNKSLYYAEPVLPRMSRSLTGMIQSQDLTTIPEQLDVYGRGVFRLHTDHFTDPARPMISFNMLAGYYPWMQLDHRPNVHETYLRESRTTIFVSVFPPKDGRAVLEAHNRLIRSAEVGNMAGSTQAALDLRGRYPDIDARNNSTDYKLIRTHIGYLCAAGEFSTALEVADAYFASFRLSEDTRFALRQRKCLEIIARATRKAIGRIALGDEHSSLRLARNDLEDIGRHALQAARHSLAEAQHRYDRADRRLRPRHTQQVIEGGLATLMEM